MITKGAKTVLSFEISLNRRAILASAIVMMAALLSFGAVAASPPSDSLLAKAAPLEITFIDVGQGDSMLIKSPDGRFMLVDGGEYRNVSAVMSTLKAKGVLRLDYVVATHPHSDHVGGLSKVIREIPVGTVFDIGRVHTTSSFEYYLNAVKSSSAKFLTIRAGGSFKLGSSVNVSFLWPYANMPSSLNDASAVMLLKYSNFEALLMADIGVDQELQLVKSSKIPAVELLKVSHHGSRHSSSSEFLKAASPDLAVIQVGGGNDYGYPQEDALTRLKAAGARVLRNDIEGAITVYSDGEKWWAETSRGTSISSSAGGTSQIPSISPSAFVGSSGSAIFHTAGCEAVPTIAKANLVIYSSREDAVAKGKRPCKICNP